MVEFRAITGGASGPNLRMSDGRVLSVLMVRQAHHERIFAWGS